MRMETEGEGETSRDDELNSSTIHNICLSLFLSYVFLLFLPSSFSSSTYFPLSISLQYTRSFYIPHCAALDISAGYLTLRSSAELPLCVPSPTVFQTD